MVWLRTSGPQGIRPPFGLHRKRLVVEVGAIVFGNVLGVALEVVRDDFHSSIDGS